MRHPTGGIEDHAEVDGASMDVTKEHARIESRHRSLAAKGGGRTEVVFSPEALGAIAGPIKHQTKKRRGSRSHTNRADGPLPQVPIRSKVKLSSR
jgi:hypothetical protein